MSQSVDDHKRIMGFLPEICASNSESWSEQTYTIKAKFQVTTLTGLEQLNYRDNCECDIIERKPGGQPASQPIEIIFMVDGSESMEDSGYHSEALAFMKKLVGSVDRDVLKNRSQEPITFTIVQFSGCAQLTKYYEPGHGFYNSVDFGSKTKLSTQERQSTFKKTNFGQRLGQASPGNYHWKSYSTLSSRTIIDEVDDGKESSFDKQIRCELEEKMILNGNSQLFLCLQDLAATADIKNPAGESFSTSFAHQLEDKMRKYTDKQTKRIVIILTDDKAFDDTEVQDLQLYNCTLDNPNPLQKKKFILDMAMRSFAHIYPVVLKTGKAKSTTEIDMLQNLANLPVNLTVDPKTSMANQMAAIKQAILAQIF